MCAANIYKIALLYNEFCTLRKVAIPTTMTMRLHTWEGLWIIWCTCSTPPTPLLPFPRPPKSASDICQYTIGLTGKTSPRSIQSYTILILINHDYGPLMLTGLFDLWRIGKRLVIPFISKVDQVLWRKSRWPEMRLSRNTICRIFWSRGVLTIPFFRSPCQQFPHVGGGKGLPPFTPIIAVKE